MAGAKAILVGRNAAQSKPLVHDRLLSSPIKKKGSFLAQRVHMDKRANLRNRVLKAGTIEFDGTAITASSGTCHSQVQRRRASWLARIQLLRSASFVIRPLPLHCLQRGGNILRPGGGCSITRSTPVPLQARQTSSLTSVLFVSLRQNSGDGCASMTLCRN